jgi:hypothetical protein
MGLGISCSQNSYLSRLRGTIARKPLWSRLGCAAIPLRISTTYPTGQSSTPKACTLSAGSGFILRQVLTSVYGPPLPTCAVQKVGWYLGYSGRGFSTFGKAARDPKPTSYHAPRPNTWLLGLISAGAVAGGLCPHRRAPPCHGARSSRTSRKPRSRAGVVLPVCKAHRPAI